MSDIGFWADLMRDTITLSSGGAPDSFGDITFGAATTYKARVVGEQKLIRGFTGLEVASRQTVYIGAAVVVQPEFQITLSTSLVNSTDDSAIHPPIIGAARYPDEVGGHHSVLYLG